MNENSFKNLIIICKHILLKLIASLLILMTWGLRENELFSQYVLSICYAISTNHVSFLKKKKKATLEREMDKSFCSKRDWDSQL